MKDAKFTPGPWIARMNCDVMAGDRLVADCMTGWLKEGRANARLIAAAPDMLDMLIELKECADYWSEYDVPLGIVDRLNAVIEKATGTTETARAEFDDELESEATA